MHYAICITIYWLNQPNSFYNVNNGYFLSPSQIAFAAVATVLNDRQRFRSFFRVLPSSSYIPASTAQLLRQFGWKKMIVITQEKAPFQAVSQWYVKWYICSKATFLETVEMCQNVQPYYIPLIWLHICNTLFSHMYFQIPRVISLYLRLPMVSKSFLIQRIGY